MLHIWFAMKAKGCVAPRKRHFPMFTDNRILTTPLAHQLGQWDNRLENAAYSAMQMEYDCSRKLDSARSDSVIVNRIDELEKAEKIAVEKIELYDNFRFLYKCLINELRIFDKSGELRDRLYAEENIKTGLDLIESLGEAKISEVVKKSAPNVAGIAQLFRCSRRSCW